jgi:hypothetical protein
MVTPDGIVESLVMLQGDCNAVATFMNTMTELFSQYIGIWMDVYLDDIVIYSNTLEDHITHVKIVVDIFMREKFYLAAAKLQILPKEVKLLGHVITREGIRMDPAKVDTVLAWPTPTNKSLVAGFNGSVGYLADNIEAVRIPMSVLSRVTRDDIPFRWGPLEDHAFNVIKSFVHGHRNKSRKTIDYSPGAPPVHLVSDGCHSGIAASIRQGDDYQTANVIAFYSAKLSPAQQNYTITEIEFLAGLEAMRRHRFLLLGVRFTWWTDHKALVFMLTQKDLEGRRARWLEAIAEFDFEIKFVPGKENVLSDALSRMWSNDAPGTVRGASAYSAHDPDHPNVSVRAALPMIVGDEARASIRKVDAPPEQTGRVLRPRVPVAPKVAPPKPVVQKRVPKPKVEDKPEKKAPAPRSRKVVIEPAETGRPETSKEFASRIRKLVLQGPAEPEDRVEGGGEPLGSPAEDDLAEKHESETAETAEPAAEAPLVVDMLTDSDSIDVMSAVRGNYDSDIMFKKIVAAPKTFKNFVMIDHVLYVLDNGKKLLCIPNVRVNGRSLREVIISSAHLLLAHLSSAKTTVYLKDHVWWYSMVDDIAKYCDSCMTCARVKPNNQKPYGLLNSLKVPNHPWERFVLRPKAETLSDTPMRSLSVAQLLLRPYASMLISTIM